MRVKHPDLPRQTWAQAKKLNLWPPAAFESLGIKSGTIRRWAADGDIKPVAVGPNGHVLYPLKAVVNKAQDTPG